MRPAGFWRRAAAWSLDAVPVALVAVALCHDRLRAAAADVASANAALAHTAAQRLLESVDATDAPLAMALGLLRDPALVAATAALQSAVLALLLVALAAFVPLFLAWCVAFEASRWQASPGKRALGLRVVAADGGRAGVGALLLRFLAGTLSWLTLNLGHLAAAFPPAHAALHDRLSGTRVRLAEGTRERLPRWAVAWLVALGAALLAAQAWLMLAFQRALLAALDAPPFP